MENKNGQGTSRLGPEKCLYQSLHLALAGVLRSNVSSQSGRAFVLPIFRANLRVVRRAPILRPPPGVHVRE